MVFNDLLEVKLHVDKVRSALRSGKVELEVTDKALTFILVETIKFIGFIIDSDGEFWLVFIVSISVVLSIESKSSLAVVFDWEAEFILSHEEAGLEVLVTNFHLDGAFISKQDS